MDWYALFPQILNMSLTSSVIIVFVFLLRLCIKRMPKVYSYVLWSVVLFRLFCPISLSVPVSLFSILETPVVERSEQETAANAERNMVTASKIEYIPSNIVHEDYPEVSLPIPVAGEKISAAVNEKLPQGAEQLAADILEAPVMIATYLWLIGVLVLSGYGVVSYIKLRQKLLGAVRYKRNVYLTDYITSPFVLGIFRPRIYLPSNLEKQEHRYIILHERCHIRRGDPIYKMLAYLALCIHWFNPFVWAAFRLAMQDMEMSCDEAVVRKLGEKIRADYSTSLLQMATGQKIYFGTPLAFGEGEPAGRIKNLARFRQPKIVVTILVVIVCSIGILICAFNPMPPDNLAVEEEEPMPEALPSPEETAQLFPDNTETAAKDAESAMEDNGLLIGDVMLTSKPAINQVSIRVEPAVLRKYPSYYYTPESEDQQWLQNYLNSLVMEGKPHDKRWSGMKETGWQIAWQDKQFMGLEGGYLYCSYHDENRGMMEIFLEEPKLCDYIQSMLQVKIGYYAWEPETIRDIVSAKLEVQMYSSDWEYYNQTITDKAALEKLESWFGNARYLFGGIECGNENSCLELTLQSGEAVRINVATDSCPVYVINGIAYDYRPAADFENREFFELFDEIPWEWLENANENTSQSNVEDIITAAKKDLREGYEPVKLTYVDNEKVGWKDFEEEPWETAEVRDMLAQAAMQELYTLTGYQVKECCYTTDGRSRFIFGKSGEYIRKCIAFYSRDYGFYLDGDSVPYLGFVNARRAHYSDVQQLDSPYHKEEYSGHGAIPMWFLEHSGVYQGEKILGFETINLDDTVYTHIKLNFDGGYYLVVMDESIESMHEVSGPYSE